jgi:predicted DNA-binding transcriptional regulator AlpA
MIETKLYFSVKDLSVRYGVSKQTVWYWLREGRLNRPVKLGVNSTRWKLIDVEQFEAERFKESA